MRQKCHQNTVLLTGDARASCSDKATCKCAPGSQGKADSSVYVSQWKSHPQPLKKQCRPRAHCWRVSSIVSEYTRPHSIRGGLAWREKQTHGSFEPPAVMAGYAAAPNKCSVTAFLHSCREQLMGQAKKALFSEACENKGCGVWC